MNLTKRGVFWITAVGLAIVVSATSALQTEVKKNRDRQQNVTSAEPRRQEASQKIETANGPGVVETTAKGGSTTSKYGQDTKTASVELKTAVEGSKSAEQPPLDRRQLALKPTKRPNAKRKTTAKNSVPNRKVTNRKRVAKTRRKKIKVFRGALGAR